MRQTSCPEQYNYLTEMWSFRFIEINLSFCYYLYLLIMILGPRLPLRRKQDARHLHAASTGLADIWHTGTIRKVSELLYTAHKLLI